MPGKSVCLISLGCPKNQVDSERLLGAILGEGWTHCEDPRAVDLVLVNTCGFIRSAKEEAIATILSYAALKEECPYLRLAVAGCLLQRYGAELEASFPEVDFWIKTADRRGLDKLLRYFGGRRAKASPERIALLNAPGTAYLKIAEGCSNACAYCAIPGIKGPLLSRPRRAVLREAKALWERHRVKELVLVAQDLTSYGVDRGEDDALSALLRGLLNIPFRWIRLLYTYPMRLSPGVIDLMASEERLCKYLDVPVQHGHPKVLRRMGRHGGPVAVLRYLEGLRERIPGLALRSTVLVGHPGEGPREFRALLAFLRRARFEWLGAFPYSEEEGTRSLRQRGKVDRRTARRRAAAAERVFREVRRLDAFGIGDEKDALVEAVENGVALCRSQTEAPEVDGIIQVPLPADGPKVEAGDLLRLRLTAAADLDFTGRLVY